MMGFLRIVVQLNKSTGLLIILGKHLGSVRDWKLAVGKSKLICKIELTEHVTGSFSFQHLRDTSGGDEQRFIIP